MEGPAPANFLRFMSHFLAGYAYNIHYLIFFSQMEEGVTNLTIYFVVMAYFMKIL